MKTLLDTCALIWRWSDPDSLSACALSLLRDPRPAMSGLTHWDRQTSGGGAFDPASTPVFSCGFPGKLRRHNNQVAIVGLANDHPIHYIGHRTVDGKRLLPRLRVRRRGLCSRGKTIGFPSPVHSPLMRRLCSVRIQSRFSGFSALTNVRSLPIRSSTGLLPWLGSSARWRGMLRSAGLR